MSSITQLTDTHKNPLPASDSEPPPASVVLAHGVHGSAWQRSFSDGLWYCTQYRGSRGKTWEWMLGRRNLTLVYLAPIRADLSSGELVDLT